MPSIIERHLKNLKKRRKSDINLYMGGCARKGESARKSSGDIIWLCRRPSTEGFFDAQELECHPTHL